MRGDAGPGGPALGRSFKQKLFHLFGTDALYQIEKRSVFGPVAATAVLLAAGEVLADIGGPHRRGRDLYAGQQGYLPHFQTCGRRPLHGKCLSHILG